MRYDMLVLMSSIERMTITLTAEMAQAVRKRAVQEQEAKKLRAEVQEGLSDIEEGRVHDLDPKRIIRKGDQHLQNSEPFA